MRLRDYFAIPYLIESSTVERSDGSWVRRLAYPELPDCVGEGNTLSEAWVNVERRRIEVIGDILRAGNEPPLLRAPVHPEGVEQDLTELGLQGQIAHDLDSSGEAVRAAQGRP
jgi:predicted RNase H-like HicB family nuclease